MSKKHEAKPEPTLLYPSAIKAIARQRRFGIEKHGSSEDWRNNPTIDFYDAIFRHLMQILEGETIDQESGELHATAIACNAMFLIEAAEGNNKLPVRMRKENLQVVH